MKLETRSMKREDRLSPAKALRLSSWIVNGLRRGVQHGTAGLFLGLAVTAAAVCAHADDAGTPGANGTSSPEIVAARELFRQGTEDVDAGRYAPALEKFRRVAAVKETANVRFNIARCEESLGKTGAALADFETAEREANAGGASANAARGDAIAKLAHDRADALRPRVPRLGVAAPTPAPPGLTVTLDGSKLALTTLGVPLPVDPGPHVIDATASGRDPFHADVTLAESESKTVTVTMALATAPVAHTTLSPAPTSATPVDATSPSSSPSSSRTTWGIVALSAGGALAVGSVVFLLVHNGQVSSVKGDCPDGRCPIARESDVTSLQSSAHTSEALSIGFAAGAAVAAGLGAYLVLSAPSAQTAPSAMIAPGAAGAPAGLSLVGRF